MRTIQPKRTVIKIGTNTICKSDGTVDQSYLNYIADQVVEIGRSGIQCIIVTSGAIGSGSAELRLDGKNKDIAMKQACAAVGQGILMMAWREAFRSHGKSVGQVLLTYGAFSDRNRYLDLKKAINAMFHLDVVPIINENDVIATDEIEGRSSATMISYLLWSQARWMQTFSSCLRTLMGFMTGTQRQIRMQS